MTASRSPRSRRTSAGEPVGWEPLIARLAAGGRVEGLPTQLARVTEALHRTLAERLGTTRDGLQRIHGDLHVGQFLDAGRTARRRRLGGQARPVARRAHASPGRQRPTSPRSASRWHTPLAPRTGGAPASTGGHGHARHGTRRSRPTAPVDRDLLLTLELEKELARARVREALASRVALRPDRRPAVRPRGRMRPDGFLRDILAAPGRLEACLDAYAGSSALDDVGGRAARRDDRDGELPLRGASRRGAAPLPRRRCRRRARLDGPPTRPVGRSRRDRHLGERLDARDRRGARPAPRPEPDGRGDERPRRRARGRRGRRAPPARGDRGGRRRLPDLPGDARRAPAPRRRDHRRADPASTSSGRRSAPRRPCATARGDWLDELAERLARPPATYAIAPAERLSSALQSALMLREGPRLRGGRDGDGRLAPRRRLPLEAPRVHGAPLPGLPLRRRRDGLRARARVGDRRRRRATSTAPRRRVPSPASTTRWSRCSWRPASRSSSPPSSGAAGVDAGDPALAA